jgi:hypothetical protein
MNRISLKWIFASIAVAAALLAAGNCFAQDNLDVFLNKLHSRILSVMSAQAAQINATEERIKGLVAKYAPVAGVVETEDSIDGVHYVLTADALANYNKLIPAAKAKGEPYGNDLYSDKIIYNRDGKLRQMNEPWRTWALEIEGQPVQTEIILQPSSKEFDWEGWHVKIMRLYLFTGEGEDSDSYYIGLQLSVTNNNHQGETFVPQNEVKLVIGENAYDAEDAYDSEDAGPWDSLNNIEPTLTREQLCYFQIPKAQLKESFTLRFESFLTGKQEIQVAVTQ